MFLRITKMYIVYIVYCVFWINANKLAALLQYLFIRILCQVKSQKAYFLRITHFIGYIITPIGGDKWMLCLTLFKNWTIQSFRFPLFCSKHWFIQKTDIISTVRCPLLALLGKIFVDEEEVTAALCLKRKSFNINVLNGTVV